MRERQPFEKMSKIFRLLLLIMFLILGLIISYIGSNISGALCSVLMISGGGVVLIVSSSIGKLLQKK